MAFSPEQQVTHSLTISIGVAVSSTRTDSPEQLLQAADQAMYRAKRTGRNRVELAGPPVAEPPP
jgi:diguanylate cyclase (GGDEF)-like protein